MALDLPDTVTVVGQLEIAKIIKEDGSMGLSIGLDGLDRDGAIGCLVSVLDRIREERKYEWETCPACFEPMSEHGEEDEEYDDDEDEDE